MDLLKSFLELVVQFFTKKKIPTSIKKETPQVNNKEISNIPKFKDKSENVKTVQISLVQRGFKIVIDSIYGNETKQAIAKLQKENKLKGSGLLGPQTIALLNITLKKVDPIKLTIPSGTKEFNKKFIIGASLEVGTKEGQGSANNKRVVEYHKYASKANKYGMDDSVPWCSSFVCFIIENFGGIESTNSALARSWENWSYGKRFDSMKGQAGDIVVFWRTSLKSGYGHVGFFLKEDKNFVWVLGGNQSDEVNITRYSKERLRGYYRHKDDSSNKEELSIIANKIMNGQKVSLGTKVV